VEKCRLTYSLRGKLLTFKIEVKFCRDSCFSLLGLHEYSVIDVGFTLVFQYSVMGD